MYFTEQTAETSEASIVFRFNKESKLEKMHAKFTRRVIIRRAALATGYGAAAATGLGQVLAFAQAAKVEQSAVQYQTMPKDKAQCSNCGSFIAPASCKQVSGTISPSGWCAVYNAKT